MRKLLFLVMALMGAVALAATANMTWTNPTENVDATPIPLSGAGSIASTRIEYGTCNVDAFGTKVGEVTVPGAATAGNVSGLAPGKWCFRAYTRNTYGSESGPSNVASKTYEAPTPKPPTNFSAG